MSTTALVRAMAEEATQLRRSDDSTERLVGGALWRILNRTEKLATALEAREQAAGEDDLIRLAKAVEEIQTILRQNRLCLDPLCLETGRGGARTSGPLKFP